MTKLADLIIWDKSKPCPCGSKKMGVMCCYDFSTQMMRKRTPRIQPRRPAEAYGHPDCFLSSTQSCSEKISKEHYISASILRTMSSDGKMIDVGGAPFMKDGMTRLPIEGMKAGVLCKAHNEALSGLDQEVSTIFSDILSAVTGQAEISPNPKLYSGTALELWMLKVLAGAYAGKLIGREKQPAIEFASLDIKNALSGEARDFLRAPQGLYLLEHAVSQEVVANVVQLMPILSADSRRVIGTGINLNGFRFICYCDARREDVSTMSMVYRPTGIRIISPNGRANDLVFSWHEEVQEKRVTLSFSPNRKL